MVKYNVEKVPVATLLGEGPHWDETTQQLLYVDIMNKSVHRYNPTTGQQHSVVIDENSSNGSVGFVVPVKSQPDKYLIGFGTVISTLTWNGLTSKLSSEDLTEMHAVEATTPPTTRFNDAKCDPSGRLWAGTMALDWQNVRGKGALFRLDTDGHLQRQVNGVGLSNGLAWSQDNTIMYYNDSTAHSVDAFDYDMATGQISNRRVVFDWKANGQVGIPDGMCIDIQGNLWVANFDGGRVLHLNPNTGTLLDWIDMPSRRVTSVAFGGRDLDVLYITSANCGLSAEETEATGAGSLYKVANTGTRGVGAGVAYAGHV